MEATNGRGRGKSKLKAVKAFFARQLSKSGASDGDKADIDAIFADIDKAIARMSSLGWGNSLGEQDVPSENHLLRYYWQAKGKQGYSSEDAELEIEEWIKEIPQEERACKIKEFAEGLRTAFDFVEEIKANNSFERETAYYVACLNYLEGYCNWLSYPMLIKARLLCVDKNAFCRLAKLVENLGFRTWVSPKSGVVDCLREAFKDINDAESFNNMIDDIKASLKGKGTGSWKFLSDSKVFKEYINTGDFYHENYKKYMCKYLLWRYEHYLRNKKKMKRGDFALIPDENVELEHIAPQNPDNPRTDGYGAYEYKGKPAAEIKSGEWLDCVGNLMLLEESKNRSLKNCPFEEKLEVYRKGRLLQQKEIEGFATVKGEGQLVWDKAAIERRHNAILAAAMEIWDLDKI